MSTEKSTVAVEDTPAEIPQLGALEEDDEFEEFPKQDWDESETDLSHLVSGPGAVGGKIDGSTQPAAEAFWEENWDDDDIEDDFSKQLREELAKVGSTTDTPMSG